MTDGTDDTADELSPAVRAAMRDVPPVDPAVREAQVAAALAVLDSPAEGRVARGGRTSGRTWLAAAAAVVLVASGVVAGRASRVDAPDLRNQAVSSTTTVPPKVAAECADQLTGRTYVGEWTDDDGTRRFLSSDGDNFYVHDLATCDIVETIPRP